jgi:hypothetical protein
VSGEKKKHIEPNKSNPPQDEDWQKQGRRTHTDRNGCIRSKASRQSASFDPQRSASSFGGMSASPPRFRRKARKHWGSGSASKSCGLESGLVSQGAPKVRRMNQTQARAVRLPARSMRGRRRQVVPCADGQVAADHGSVEAELAAMLIDQGRRLAAAAERAIARAQCGA